MARERRIKKRHWCFTSYEEKLPVVYDPIVVRYVIYQQELCPETKRCHWQGYIEFFDSVRTTKVKDTVGECHCEYRRGSRTEAREYCRKKETAVANTQFEFGEWRADVSRKRKLGDMLKGNMTLDELIKESPVDYVRYHRGLEKLFARRMGKKARQFRRVTVLVYVGPTGTGKTRKACAEPDHFVMPLGDKLWFDGYNGEKCLIIDDYYGNIKYQFLLRILDGHELQMPYKGGFIWSMWNKVIITSNQHPRLWYTHLGYPAALQRRITNIIFFPANVEDVILVP